MPSQRLVRLHLFREWRIFQGTGEGSWLVVQARSRCFFRCSTKTMQVLAYLPNFLSFSTFEKHGGVQCNMFQWRVFGGVVFAQDRSALLEHKKPQGSREWLDRCLYMDLSIGDGPLLATPKWPAKSFNWGHVKPSYSFLRQILQRCRPKQFLWMTSEGNELSCDHRLKYTW